MANVKTDEDISTECFLSYGNYSLVQNLSDCFVAQSCSFVPKRIDARTYSDRVRRQITTPTRWINLEANQ